MNGAKKLLVSALRQYRHNDGGQVLLAGYDETEAEKVVEELQAENKLLKEDVKSVQKALRVALQMNRDLNKEMFKGGEKNE